MFLKKLAQVFCVTIFVAFVLFRSDQLTISAKTNDLKRNSNITVEQKQGLMLNCKKLTSPTVGTIVEKTGSREIALRYPVTNSELINTTVKKWAETQAEEFKAANPETNTIKLDISFEKSRYLEPKLISYKFNIKKFVNQNILDTQVKTFIFDLEKGTELQLSDLFRWDVNYYNILSGKLKEKLPQQSTENIEFNSFILREQSLLFFFNAKGTTGQKSTTQLEIPLTELTDVFAIYDKPTNQPIVALTFDDGPHKELTPKLLDMLKQYNARATFFVVGNRVKDNPDIITRMKMEGHEVANHSYSHADLTKGDEVAVRNEIDSTNQLIKDLGFKPDCLRPPYGAHNAMVDNIAQQAGMSIVLWSVDTLDWKYRDAGYVANQIITQAKSGDIVLLHDIHATSVEAVGIALQTLTNQGYRFVTVDQLLSLNGGVQPGISYTKLPNQ